MKKFALLAVAFAATAAMATPVTPPAPSISSGIDILGNSIQVVYLKDSLVLNKAYGKDANAQQTLASNAGNVQIGGDSVQAVVGKGSFVGNFATANTTAMQNLSSNVGDVNVADGGLSVQLTVLKHSAVVNYAYGKDALAVQSLASNNACFLCVPGTHKR